MSTSTAGIPTVTTTRQERAATDRAAPPGSTVVVGDEGVERVLELTSGVGADAVLECVGTDQSVVQARRSRPGPRPPPDLLGRVWDGRIDPGRVFDLTLPLEQVAEGYVAMDEWRATKVLLRP